MTDANPLILNNFKFQFEWAGASLGFSEALGLGEPDALTLSRGLFLATIGFNAWLEIVSSTAQDLTFHLQDDQAQTIASWVVEKAILIHHVASLDADENVIAIESLQVQHAGLTLLRR